MRRFNVYYTDSEGRECCVGTFTARSAAGALQQFARDLRHFPTATAIRAEAA